jgi:DNA polymerase-4
VDEAFLDVTGCPQDAITIGHAIKATIKKETNLTASLGIASNKFLAKVASDLKKPDGFVIITEANKQQILDPLPLEKLRASCSIWHMA